MQLLFAVTNNGSQPPTAERRAKTINVVNVTDGIITMFELAYIINRLAVTWHTTHTYTQ
jgi:hypothetical protein